MIDAEHGTGKAHHLRGQQRYDATADVEYHKLFEREGTTLSRFFLGLRLVQVHRMLRDLRHGHLTIAAIACRAGFNDLSTFNREFRWRYGAISSDVRAMGRMSSARCT
jgi:AraC-like DNA-binding protein